MSQVRRLGFRAVGDDALLVEVGDAESAQAAYRLVRRLSASDRVGGGLAPPRDVVPGARTVLLDGIDDATIAGLNIPTGIPLVYELDAELKPLTPGGTYLDAAAAAAAVQAVANQGR